MCIRDSIRMSGRREIDITYTGLRPGEKLTEDLVSRAEDATPTKNPLVTCAKALPMDPSQLPESEVPDHSTAISRTREHALTRDAGEPDGVQCDRSGRFTLSLIHI